MDPIRINDLVIIVDPKFPRNTWPKGRVIGIKRGQDNQVRSATVQTINGIYERPAVKLAVLDVGVRCNAAQEDRIVGGVLDSLRQRPSNSVCPTVTGAELPHPVRIEGTGHKPINTHHHYNASKRQ